MVVLPTYWRLQDLHCSRYTTFLEVERWGDACPDGADTATSRLFPTAERLAEAELDGLGVPGRRAGAIVELARRSLDGRLVLDGRATVETVVEQLEAIPGVGPWTSHYVALRVLGEPDALPASDLVLRQALPDADGRPATTAQVRRHAERWRPWRAYALLHLWTETTDASHEGDTR